MGSGSPSELVQKSSVWSKIVGFPQFGILIVFIGLFAVLGIMAPESFLSGGNLINVMRQASAQMVVAIGMTFVLILGGIDLSVGSVANLCGTISAGLIVKNGMSLEAAVVIGMAIGLGLGVVNGIVISKLKLQPFIATLAMMSIAKGASLLYSGGMPISQLGDAYIELGRGYVGILPIPVIIMIAVIAVAWIILGRTVFGRRVYMTGGNEEAARLSGIKVDRIKIIVYAICGLHGCADRDHLYGPVGIQPAHHGGRTGIGCDRSGGTRRHQPFGRTRIHFGHHRWRHVPLCPEQRPEYT